MTSFKFHVGSKSVERSVADAIGRELSARLPQSDDLPQRWLDILKGFETKDAQASKTEQPKEIKTR